MIFETTVPQSLPLLPPLDGILAKIKPFCDAKKIEPDVLLNSRLAADQFNFIRQVQIATDSAKIGIARATGKDAPPHDDKETTVEQLQTRIKETVKYLSTITEKDLAGASERRITTPRWEGKTLSGHEYLIQHSTPNTYFHITVAYEILRHNGLDVGKKDYLGPMPFKA